jgi:hypothetical protein
MTLSSAPWWCGPVLAFVWIQTVPARIFCAPAWARSIAAARVIPGVWGVFGSSASKRTMRPPWSRQDADGSVAGMLPLRGSCSAGARPPLRSRSRPGSACR